MCLHPQYFRNAKKDSESEVLFNYSFYKRNPIFISSILGKYLFLNPKIQLISSIFDIPVPNLWYAKMFCSFDEGHVVLHPAGTCVGILIPVSCQPMIILSMVSAGILPITAAPHSNTPLMSSAVIFLHLSSIPSPIYWHKYIYCTRRRWSYTV